MSAATALLPPTPVYTDEPIYRLSVDQYHDLIDRGKLTADDPVELIEGVLVFKMPKNRPHKSAVRRCNQAISAILPENYFYDQEQPITLADGEPEPDGMVVAGKIEDYDNADVEPSKVSLVIEIAEATLKRDRGPKLRSYARAGIVCYWIVNLNDRQIEVYTQPDAAAEIPTYRKPQIFKPGGSIPLAVDGRTLADISVDEILPKTI
jgi:Uma2 family endonuclease